MQECCALPVSAQITAIIINQERKKHTKTKIYWHFVVFGRFYANRLCAGAPGRVRCSRAIARSLCEGTANAQISACMHLMYQPGSKGAASVITRLLDALRGRATAQHLRLERCALYETLASGAAFPLTASGHSLGWPRWRRKRVHD